MAHPCKGMSQIEYAFMELSQIADLITVMPKVEYFKAKMTQVAHTVTEMSQLTDTEMSHFDSELTLVRDVPQVSI
jgi:hypothetical protein